jgi:hypothetical protein
MSRQVPLLCEYDLRSREPILRSEPALSASRARGSCGRHPAEVGVGEWRAIFFWADTKCATASSPVDSGARGVFRFGFGLLIAPTESTIVYP